MLPTFLIQLYSFILALHLDQFLGSRSYLRDEDQSVARKYQAQCTPDIYVYNKERELCYHGQIDDNWQEPDKVTSHDLSDAIEALLEGKKPSPNQYPSMGCSIKWKE